MADTRRDLIAVEIDRLKEEGTKLDRDWARIPWLAGTIVLAGPAHLIWGPTAAVYAVLCVPCLIGTALYLVGVRRRENTHQIEELSAQLASMDG